MMIKYKTYFKKAVLFFLFSITTTVSSQAPGYMGKRLTVNYGFYANPALAATISGYGKSLLNTQHEGSIEYAVGQKVALGFSARFYKSSYYNTRSSEFFGSYVFESPSGMYSINGKNYSFYAKFFKGNYVAPWGTYFLFGLALNTYETTYDPQVMKLQRGGAFVDFGNPIQSYQAVDIIFGNGKTRILGNRVVVDYGYNINFIAVTSTFLKFLTENSEINPTVYIEETSAKRVRGINRFNLFFKVGYLF